MLLFLWDNITTACISDCNFVFRELWTETRHWKQCSRYRQFHFSLPKIYGNTPNDFRNSHIAVKKIKNQDAERHLKENSFELQQFLSLPLGSVSVLAVSVRRTVAQADPLMSGQNR